MSGGAAGEEAATAAAGPPAAASPEPSVLARLLKGSLVYGLADFAQKAIGFVLIPLYTRFLAPDDYGVIGVLGALSALLVVLFGVGLRASIVRHYYDHRDDPARLRKYVGTALVTLLAVGGGLAALATLAAWALEGSVPSSVPFRPHLLLTIWGALFVAVHGVFLGLFRAREQPARYGAVQLGHFLLSTLLVVYLVAVARLGVLGWVYGQFAAGLVVLLVLLGLGFRDARPSFSRGHAREALVFGLPLVPHMLSSGVLAAVDRLFLERMVQPAQVGLYTLGYQVAMMMGFVVFAVNSAWVPISYDLARRDPQADQRFASAFAAYVAAMVVLAAGLVLFAREIVALVAPASYLPAHAVVPVVAVAYLFQGFYLMAVVPLFREKRTRVIPLLSGGAALLQVALLLALIPPLGILGAAWATLASYAALFLASLLVAQRVRRVPYEWGRFAVSLAALAAVSAVAAAAPALAPAMSLGLRAATLLALPLALLALGAVRREDLAGLRRPGGA